MVNSTQLLKAHNRSFGFGSRTVLLMIDALVWELGLGHWDVNWMIAAFKRYH